LKSTDAILFLLALCSIFLSNFIASLRWSILLKEVNAKQSPRLFNAFGSFCFGQVAGLVVPSRIGNYTKIPLIKKLDDLPFEKILSAVNAETVLDLAYICCAGIVSIIILSAFFSMSLYFSTILIVLILVILIGSLITIYNIQRLHPAFEKVFSIASDPNRNWLTRLLLKGLAKFFGIIQSTRNIFSKKDIVVKISVLTVITQGFGVMGLFFIIESVHISLPFIKIFAILTLTYIVGIASLIPGGFGVSDLSLIALLVFEGVPLTLATNIVILWRVAIYFPVLIIVGFYFLRRNELWKKIKN
jgi:uncharacterized protein (TIRG00374 family)